MSTAPADVRVDRLHKSFGATAAVRDVSFALAPGHLLALLGPSGCGKTTTLRMLAGLVRPDAGIVSIGGTDVTAMPVHRRNVGMLFQNYALFPHMSAAENVAFGLEMRHVGRDETRRRVGEALKLVQLDGLEARLPAQLSGGQQQRVALARALVINPSVLLLDEPFGALDRRLRETMQIEMRALQERLRITTVLVTHDQEEALTLANEIAIMRDGVIEQIGSPGEIYERPRSRFVADFIGAANFLRGRIALSPGGRAFVRCDAGIGLALDAVDATIADGAQVTIALRPENIRISAGSGDEPNMANGTLERVVYRGASSHFHVRLADGSLLIAVQQGGRPGADPACGGPACLRWEPSAARIVRD
jgi:putative spermidine/putrescine transport system ATP-binding protein